MVMPCVEEAIRERRSIRRFQGPEVDREVIRRLLESACMAPSPHNAQPWRFAAVTDSNAREMLAREMAGAWREDLRRDGAPEPAIEGRVAASQRRMTSAVPIVVCIDRTDLDRYPDERRQAAEVTMAVQSIGAAVQNLLLAAHSTGLGGIWMCAPVFCPEVVRSCLGLPGEWEPQALVLVGRPAEQPKAPRRKPLAEVALFVEGAR